MSTSKPTVEVLGPWLLNKGDDLMLRSVMERLGDKCILAVSSDMGSEEFQQSKILPEVKWFPALHEFRDAARARSFSRGAALLRRSAGLALAPRKVLRWKGIAPGRDVSALLDASGFCYGDQWSVKRLKTRSSYYAGLKRQGAKLIMLPQALGPFEKPEVRACSQKVFQHFDLIYARDNISRDHMLKLDYPASRVRVAPDITTLLEVDPPADRRDWGSRVCVVPNKRMVDRTDQRTSSRYIHIIVRAIRLFREKNLEPVLLLHERNDWPLANEIRSLAGVTLQILDEDAAVSKGILGASYAVFSSRYHALVGALSQATPALGTSWAHKYDELFEEFGCSEMLISPAADDDEIDSKISYLVDPAGRQAIHERITRKASERKQNVVEMWGEIEANLGLDLQAA